MPRELTRRQLRRRLRDDARNRSEIQDDSSSSWVLRNQRWAVFKHNDPLFRLDFQQPGDPLEQGNNDSPDGICMSLLTVAPEVIGPGPEATADGIWRRIKGLVLYICTIQGVAEVGELDGEELHLISRSASCADKYAEMSMFYNANIRSLF